MDQILNKGPSKIARDLSQRSLEKLKEVPFGDFVRKALGLPSERIKTFLWTYEVLSAKLYFDLIKAPMHLSQLLGLKQVFCSSARDDLLMGVQIIHGA